MNKGVASGDIGDLSTAEQCYDKALSLDPNYSDACYNKAELFLKQERFEDSIPYYDRSLEINPNDFSALYGRGTAYLNIAMRKRDKQESNESDLQEALTSFDKALNTAIKLNPQQEINLYNNRGVALYMLGREEEALECSDHILAINPQSTRGLYLKNMCTGKPLFKGINDPEFFKGWLEDIAEK